MVSSISILIPAVFCLSLVNGMVAPFSYKSAADTIIFLNQMKIILKVSRPVAHGMAVLAYNKRLVWIALYIVQDSLKARIHAAVQVKVGIIIFSFSALVIGTFIILSAFISFDIMIREI